MSTTFNRNNTNFAANAFEYLRNVPSTTSTPYAFLKYYQNLVKTWATHVDIGAKGMLLYHEMGLGKSMLATAITMEFIGQSADRSMRQQPPRKPIIMLAKSLQSNMRGAIRKYVHMRAKDDTDWPIGKLAETDLDTWVNQQFKFVSMNASNMLTQLEQSASDTYDETLGQIAAMPSLNGCILIVDEAHNWFRAITNGSKNAIGAYNMVMHSPDVKLFLLSGTPIAHDPFELVPCFNMLSDNRGGPLLPEDYKEFYKLYVNGETHRVKNKGKLQNRLNGLISYVGIESVPGAAFGHTESLHEMIRMPVNLGIKLEYVPMDADQYVAYGLARDKELAEGASRAIGKFAVSAAQGFASTPRLTKPKSHKSSTHHAKTRALGNFAGEVTNESEAAIVYSAAKFVRMYDNITAHDGQLGLVYSQFAGSGGLASFEKFLQSKGWARYTPDLIIGGDDASLPSMDNWVERRLATESHGGDDDSAAVTTPRQSAKRYAVISGSVDYADRELIKNVFNAERNKHGGVIDLLLVSAAGAEGLDLKNIRHTHILEPYWDMNRHLQIIYRALRGWSHEALDESERNVQTYIYLAVAPDSARRSDGTLPITIDVELYEKAGLQYELIMDFCDALQGVSIECQANGCNNCRVCTPNNRTLFTGNPAQDATSPDPCTTPTEMVIKAQKITINDIEYYYTEDKIYIKDPAIGAYRVLVPRDPNYAAVYAVIWGS